MGDARCLTCRWWDTAIADGRDDERSPCRANPPVIGFGSSVGIWPMVDADDWCRSHEPLPAPAPVVQPDPNQPNKCPTCGIADWRDCDCVPF